MARETVDSYVRKYKFPNDFSGSTTERVAKFLHELAELYPGDFIDRFLLMRVVHNLKAVPRAGTEKMKSCSYHVQQAQRLLQKRHQQHIINDRTRGYRATASADDIHDIKYKQATQRQAVATKTAVAIADTIDPKHLTGNRKEEFLKTRSALKSIESQLVNLLPPKPKD